jgi:hypothetical protein
MDKLACYCSVLFALILESCLPCVHADEVQFNRDIRPILSDNCFACHGPDASGRKADLRLDERSSAIDSGAIVVTESAASELLKRVLSSDPDSIMPPPTTGKKLTSKQIQLLRQWIDQGAEYQSHWSFIPVPKSIALPESSPFASWAKQDLDRFVAASWIPRGLTPAPEASRAQWLRRVSFDLTGLPPSIDELRAFEQDTAPEAYERVVDRLLDSDAYGERMASMWLDVARYADTFGYQSDVGMEMWPWRDWVIRAFNQNLSYRDFVRWQTAGDLIPNANLDSRIATGFNRLHRQTNEGGSVVEEFRIANIADRTTTNGTAFLGLTLECARCHDHKYDPILQKEFYRLSAYFADIDELGVYSHFTHSAPTPALLLYSGEQESQHRDATAAVEKANSSWAAALSKAMERTLPPADITNALPPPPEPDFQSALEGDVPGVVGKATRCDGDEEIKLKDVPDFGRADPFTISIWVKPAHMQSRMILLHQSVAAEDSAFRGIQWTIDDGHPEFSMIHFWPGNAVRVESTATIPTDEWSLLTVTHDGSGTANGLSLFINGKRTPHHVERDQLTRDVKHRSEWGDSSAGKVKMAIGARFRDIGLRDGCVDELRVFSRWLSAVEVASLFASVRGGDWQPNLSKQDWQKHYAYQDEKVAECREALISARRNENEIVTKVREIMTMKPAVIPRQTFVLQRGEYHAPSEQVDAGTPALFAASAKNTDRAAFAEWLTSDENPLVSRVMVNRLWHMFFGRGIVASLEDFGSQGTPPSHPALLDHLARTFMDDGWDMKRFCRRLVLSSTYRQSSTPAAIKFFEVDPDNVWLARGPKHRLSAEQVRDAALAASGLLVRQVGGPSVMPYQPAGLWEEAGTGKSYKQATGDGLYRRSLYTFWKRTAPPPSMLSFDATSRETCTAKRELTTTPLQALVLLNDPQYVEAARVLAEQLVKKFSDNADARLVEACERLITRRPTDAELAIQRELYHTQLRRFQEQADAAEAFLKIGERKPDASLPADQVAATAVVVNMLLSYDETMMKR